MNQSEFNSSMPLLHTQLCNCTPKPAREPAVAMVLKQRDEETMVEAELMEQVPTFLQTEKMQTQVADTTLTRVWSWLHGKCVTKRLRVAETISLGEKRFVAIVSVEGREFLIGGGAAGMSLLAQLENAAAGGNGTSAIMQRGGGRR